eukprot:GHVP01063464.1.p1 GENE.GHVP01063464.1~~GHVP01063464.1.p1  ORF type:complete len:456 (+),score=102.73 GHVP01063464.1:3-1370(+)
MTVNETFTIKRLILQNQELVKLLEEYKQKKQENINMYSIPMTSVEIKSEECIDRSYPTKEKEEEKLKYDNTKKRKISEADELKWKDIACKRLHELEKIEDKLYVEIDRNKKLGERYEDEVRRCMDSERRKQFLEKRIDDLNKSLNRIYDSSYFRNTNDKLKTSDNHVSLVEAEKKKLQAEIENLQERSVKTANRLKEYENEIERLKKRIGKCTEDDLLIEIDDLSSELDSVRKLKSDLEEDNNILINENKRFKIEIINLEKKIQNISEMKRVFDEKSKIFRDKEIELEKKENMLKEERNKLELDSLFGKDKKEYYEKLIEEKQNEIKEENEKYLNEVKKVNNEMELSVRIEGELRRIKKEKRFLEDRISIFNSWIDKDGKEKDVNLIMELNEQICIYKGMIRCGVCEEGNKEVVLRKCNHTFCSKCINEGIKTRQRRCPLCGDSYGANDIMKFFL